MDSSVREVHNLVQKHAPTVLCVVETQLHKVRVEGPASRLGFDKSFAISSTGRSGGLDIFWNNNINVEILPYSQYHIDAVVTIGGEVPWRLTCVYGEANTAQNLGDVEVY